MTAGLYVGLMSGTSMDGIDAVLIHLGDDPGGDPGGDPGDDLDYESPELKATYSSDFPHVLRDQAQAVASGQLDDLHTVARLNRDLAACYATCVESLLREANVEAEDVIAIGSHGQTVRHHPSANLAQRYTVQLGDPSTIAEQTGITTVADFRPRDIAAGGQGAPLAPGFHADCFGKPGVERAVINIGGIANTTLLNGRSVVAGYDSGPGNTLLDAWIRKMRGEAFDALGAWSAEHVIDSELLDTLCGDPFFHREGPRSTGTEYFNLDWVAPHLSGKEEPGVVMATLCELTAKSIVDSLPNRPLDGAYVCGGGARNTDLMRRIHRRLSERDIALGTTDDLGIAAEWVEAAAWAWLAARTLASLPGNEPVVTGAEGPRILGGIYPA